MKIMKFHLRYPMRVQTPFNSIHQPWIDVGFVDTDVKTFKFAFPFFFLVGAQFSPSRQWFATDCGQVVCMCNLYFTVQFA